MKIGILGTSDIAFRRFLPALEKIEGVSYVGVATRTLEKGKKFQETYGGNIYDGYQKLLEDDSIDAVYVPLPPALHYEWGKKVLEAKKHLFMEKPFAMSVEETEELINLAKENNLAIHENYMFVFHNQLEEIKKIITDGTLGNIRLYRIAFGFPKRQEGDFRYNKELGGGSLFDCGGYTLKLANILLGGNSRVKTAILNYEDPYEVDLYGSATLVNDKGVTAQVSFGMDNSYKCELEIWGSKGCFRTNRILTAPAGYEPTGELVTQNDTKEIKLSSDDTFYKSQLKFLECIKSKEVREEVYEEIEKQAQLVKKVNEVRK